MTLEDEFAERLARVRARFAAALDGKIGDSFAALETMAGGGETIEIVIAVHRRLHEMCGIAATLDFAAIGNAAGSAESVMCAAAKAKRALTPAEMATLKSELEALRRAAAGDLAAYSNRDLFNRPA